MAGEADDLLINTDVSDNDTGSGSVVVLGERRVNTRKLPAGVWIFEKVGLCNLWPRRG